MRSGNSPRMKELRCYRACYFSGCPVSLASGWLLPHIPGPPWGVARRETDMSRSSLAFLTAAVLVLGGCEAHTLDTTESSSSQGSPAESAVSMAPVPTPVPVPETPPKPATLRVPSGTVFDVELSSELDSGRNQVGDEFSARVTSSVVIDGQVSIPAGSTVHGTIEEVKAAKRGAGNASMTLRFHGLGLTSGHSIDISASISEGTGGKKKRNAAIIGGSAAGGAILGRVLGHGSKDSAIGAIVGGAIGTGVVVSKKGDQVKLPAGTTFSIQLDETIQVPANPPTS